MLIRSRAPLRIGLAGGGTDVSPYSDLYGGAILNASISMFAYASIEPLDNGKIIIQSFDRNQEICLEQAEQLPINGELDLAKGVYNRIVKDFSHKSLSFRLSTFVDAPMGSGLGSSSTLVVTILGAFAEWLKLPLGEYDMAKLAYDIERKDLALAGGKQDQYAATFGGFNFMEFHKDDKVIVNPLRVKSMYVNELANNLLLYYTDSSRLSSAIIESQSKNVRDKKEASLEAMHHLKEQAVMMKEAILTGALHRVGEILDFGWQNKKKLTEGISNESIDAIYTEAIKAGASGGKISGAGGGGFMFFYCPKNTKFQVIRSLERFGGKIYPFEFTMQGLTSWTI